MLRLTLIFKCLCWAHIEQRITATCDINSTLDLGFQVKAGSLSLSNDTLLLGTPVISTLDYLLSLLTTDCNSRDNVFHKQLVYPLNVPWHIPSMNKTCIGIHQRSTALVSHMSVWHLQRVFSKLPINQFSLTFHHPGKLTSKYLKRYRRK